jgi:hypothetical protein
VPIVGLSVVLASQPSFVGWSDRFELDLADELAFSVERAGATA